MHDLPTATESAAGGASGDALAPVLESGLQEMSIAETPPRLPPPSIPDTLTPAPVTVVRSTPSQAPPPSVSTRPNATPPTSLPGMPDQQFKLMTGSGVEAQAQVSSFSRVPVTMASYLQTITTSTPLTLPSAPPTISLPSVPPTISLGPAPKLIS